MINIYVVWSFDGPIMTTLLQFDDKEHVREVLKNWSTQDFVEYAWDIEYPDEDENLIEKGESYELAAIFEVKGSLDFIY